MPSTLQTLTGSRVRADIIALLFGHGGAWSAYELARTANLAYSSVRRHLQALIDAGLVVRLPSGQLAANTGHPDALALTRMALDHWPPPEHKPDIDWRQLLQDTIAGAAALHFLHGSRDVA